MNYTIELNENQMRVMEKCINCYMRLMTGQSSDFTTEIAKTGMDLSHDNPKHEAIFDRYIQKRDDIDELMRALFRIVAPFGITELSEDVLTAQDLWDSIRCAAGTSRWSEPLQRGKDPLPKIEKKEE